MSRETAQRSGLSRRTLLRQGAAGLAMLGVSGLVLRAGAAATPAGDPALEPGHGPTEPNVEGPFYRSDAPFRAALAPEGAAGTPLRVVGRIWGLDTRRPLAGALLDLWHADHAGEYDNESPRFLYRGRLNADATGAYTIETVHPGPYATRPSHIHYKISQPGYRALTTQLYFAGDPRLADDAFARSSLVIALERVPAGGTSAEWGVFDIVLARA